MQEPYIRDKGYELSSRYSLSPNAMRNSNILDTNQNRWDLLYYQLSWLAQPIGDRKSGITAFPNIRIVGGYEAPVSGKLDWAGRAQLDLVQVRAVGDNVQQNGEFKIELNRYHTLDTEYQDPNVWAGIIVHEMLHNLGHDHANGYEIKYQVNVMGDVVQTDGGDYTQSYIRNRKSNIHSILDNLNCDRSDRNELNVDTSLGESEETTIIY